MVAVEETAVRASISTGQVEIDKKLGGGIPKGSLIFIEGSSDSGKSVLTQQITWGTLRGGSSVTIFTTENTVKSMMRHTRSLNLEMLDYVLLGRLRIYPLRAARESSQEALARLSRAIRQQASQDLIFIDSITSYVAHAPAEEVIAFFEEVRELTDEGMTIALVAHSYAFNEGMLVRLSSMCDVHLRLSTQNMGEKLIKMLEVSKIRGAQLSTGNIISFDIEPGWGMRIIPFTKARA